MKKITTILITAVLILTFAVNLPGEDSIELLTGGTLKGTIVDHNETSITIEINEDGMSMKMPVTKSKIHAVTIKGKRKVLNAKPVPKKRPVRKPKPGKTGKGPNRLTVTFTNTTAEGRFKPHHCVAVWVEDSAGKYITSLDVWGKHYYRYLLTWRNSYQKVHKTGFDMDAISGATQKAYGTLTTKWDLKDGNGKDVPDGTYRICMELTDENSQTRDENHFTVFSFTKDGKASEQKNPGKDGFKDVALSYAYQKPEADHLKISFTNSTANGRFKPHHCVAVWIEDSKGTYIRSLDVWGKRYYRYLLKWRDSYRKNGQTGFDMAAISGATIKGYGQLSTAWDMRDKNGQEVPDGTYKICFELTDENSKNASENNYASFAFKKDGRIRKQAGLKQGGFKEISFDYIMK